MLAGVPFFDEVFRQLDCTYVIDSISRFKFIPHSYSIVEAKSTPLASNGKFLRDILSTQSSNVLQSVAR